MASRSRNVSKSNTTHTRVEFHTWANGLIVVDTTTNPSNPTTSLIGWEHSQRIGDAASTIAISLKGYAFQPGPHFGKPWTDLVAEGDYWLVETNKNGRKHTVMFGRVDSVALGLTANMGEGQAVVTVNGRGYGFQLADTPVYFNPYDPLWDNAIGINMLEILEKIVGPADEVVFSMIKGMMGFFGGAALLGSHNRVPPSFAAMAETTNSANLQTATAFTGQEAPGFVNQGAAADVKSYWIDYVDFLKRGDLRGEVFAADAIEPEGAPSVWDFVKTWMNPVLNELWMDIDPRPGHRRAKLVIREKPYVNAADRDQSPWFNLFTRGVEASTLVGTSLTRGPNRVNHLILMGDLIPSLAQDTYALHPPAVNVASIERYGLRRLEEKTLFFPVDTAHVSEINKWRSLVVSWNVLNHEYWTGQLQIGELRPDIRIGEKVAILNGPVAKYLGLPADAGMSPNQVRPGRAPRDALTFYVEGVTLRYAAGEKPTMTTSLMVSRGMREGDRVRRLVREFAKWADANIALAPEGSLGTFSNQDLGAIDNILKEPS